MCIGFCGRSASCDITHKTDREYDLLQAWGSVSCDITHETRGPVCYGHRVQRPVISPTRQGLRCVFGYHARDRGYDLFYGHWVLRLVISHTRQRVRFVTGIGFCFL